MVEDVYFLKIRKIRYLLSKNFKEGCCQICGKKRKTTAHHLIPKRLRCICPILAEIRVRVCLECDLMFHPENKFIRESEIIQRQSKYILKLKETISLQNKEIKYLVECIKSAKNKKQMQKESNQSKSDSSTFLILKKEVGKCGK